MKDGVELDPKHHNKQKSPASLLFYLISHLQNPN